MARIRTIKPEFWSSEKIVECSMNARLLFIGLWTFADDSGVLPLKPRQIKMQVFPGDDMSSEDVRRMIDELSVNDLLEIYDLEGAQYLRIMGFRKHQKVDQPTYKHPLPDGTIPRKVRRQSAENSANDRRTPDETSPPIHPGSRMESNGVEWSRDPDANASGAEAPGESDEVRLFRRGKDVLGKSAGRLISKVRKHAGSDTRALQVIEEAAGKQSPREWVGAVLRGDEDLPPSLDEICPPEIYGAVQ